MTAPASGPAPGSLPGPETDTGTGNSVRLAFYYGAVFALIGIHLPFWPVWLAAKGLEATEIGALIAAGVGVKVVFNPLIAHIADRRGQRRPIMLALALAGLAAFSLFGVTDGFWALLLVTVMFFAVWSPIMPLGESLTMLSRRRDSTTPGGKELDYGRIRLWGSLSFMATAVGAGYVLAGRDPDIIYWAILSGLAVTVAVIWALPSTKVPARTGKRLAALEILRDRPFCLFITAAALIQASHAVYYGFGTLNWKAQGYSENVIGWLWAEGVAAEIILFAFGARLIRRFGPVRLIALGGLAGALRWSVTGAADGLLVLIAMQALHGFTFGATHLGAIYFIARRMPQALSASAQSLYSAVVMGLALGAASLAAGKLYALYGSGAYQAMALLAAAGGGAALMLMRSR
ncbi:MAG: MFS transporter [Proteobacteria bacterium]|nr:MFS transporter [Pseudomonadota bacterium]